MVTPVLNAWDLVAIVVLVVGATVYLRSSLAKQRTSELENLANTRKDKIDDLTAEVSILESRISKLEGAYEGLQALKVTEIADEVVARLATTHLLKER